MTAKRNDGKEGVAHGSPRREKWENWWVIDIMGQTEASFWASSLATGWLGDHALR